MDAIIREWDYEEIMKNIDEILNKSEETDDNYIYRVELLEKALKSIKEDLKIKDNIIGTLGIIWQKEDVIKEFRETYDRDPTKEELDDILKNYLNLIDIGEGVAIKEGWEVIYSALDNWEIDNPQEN